MLAGRVTVPSADLDAVLSDIVREVGWRAADSAAPASAEDISSARHWTTNLLRALNLLSTGRGWQDRSYGLTPTGRKVALQCLHHRATVPRSCLWTEMSQPLGTG